MADSAIEWTDKVWNPTRGCSRVSPGCEACYAERQAIRHAGPGGSYEGLARSGKNGPRWTGVVRLIGDKLDEPLRWKKPARIFVNSMSDLFHESLTDEEIAAVFGVMAAAPQHTFQVLTKRADRMQQWFERAQRGASNTSRTTLGWIATTGWRHLPSDVREHLGLVEYGEMGAVATICEAKAWPLPNVWLGVSVEDQQRADERIPQLFSTPAAVRFLSVEPLLGPVDLSRYAGAVCATVTRVEGDRMAVRPDGRALHWVIVGGESGPGARHCDVAWIRSVVDQCRAAGVPTFVKQVGANVRDRDDVGFDGREDDAWDIDGDLEAVERDPNGYREDYQGAQVRIRLRDKKGGDPSEWPADLRVRQFPVTGE